MTLAALRDLLNTEDKIYCLAARVGLHDGETVHYRVTAEGAMQVDVLTHRHSIQVSALMKGGGFWRIPPIGAEVMLCFDDGEFEGDAYLVSPHEDAPTGLVIGKTFVLDDTVEIRSADGTATKLPTWADFAALVNFIQAMTLPVSGATAGPPAPGTVPTGSGTNVLKGE